MFKHAFFINLDERVDRLIQVKRELIDMGISAERFAAIKSKNGAIGCAMSHIKCLEMAKERGYSQVFICEDDIQFLNRELLIENLRKFESSEFAKNWDVLILGGNNCPPYDKLSDYCIQVYNCQTTTGYIVKNHYYDILIENYKTGMLKLLREPDKKTNFAIDVYWKLLQTSDKWYMIVPLTITQRSGFSDIEKHDVDYTNLMLDLDKEWLMKRQRTQFRQMAFCNSSSSR